MTSSTAPPAAIAPEAGSEAPAPFSRIVRYGVILGALTALGPLAIDMYLPSFSAVAKDLGAPPESMQSTLAIYFIGLALGQAFYGPISDRIGRKVPLYVGLAIFIGASVAIAFTHSLQMLIALRFLQAIGGCAEMVISRAIVRDLFRQRDSARVMSFLVLVMGLAPILAPLAGGQLLAAFGWRSTFWVLAVAGALCLVAVTFTLPETLPPERRTRHELSAVFRVYGALLRDRRFMSDVLTGTLNITSMFAYIAGSPFVFIEYFGVSPQRFGLFFGTNALGIITAAQINGVLVRRFDPETIVRPVLACVAVSSVVLLGAALTGIGGFPGFLVPLFITIASMGLISPNTTAMAMAPHGRVAGSASALLGTTQFFFAAIAGALVGKLHNGTPVPMAGIIAFCAVSAFVIFWSAHRRRP